MPETYRAADGRPAVPDAETIAALLKKAGTTLECELRGASMGASIPDGSSLRLRFAEAPLLSVGDVIAFNAAGSIVVHRIVGRGRFGPARSFLLTRGDGSVLVDHPVHVGAILGVVREWSDGREWRPVPPCVFTGWRYFASQILFWPVLAALHVERRFAMVFTVGAFTLRAGLRRLAPSHFGN